jgi:serine/threonine protein phosphatase PrpC
VDSSTDVGRARARNEDCLYIEPLDSAAARTWGWFGAVADGVGGRQAGDVASRLAVQVTRDTFYGGASGEVGSRLSAAVEQANQSVFQEAQTAPERSGMASTITAALILHTGDLWVAHVGDSRAYLLRGV